MFSHFYSLTIIPIDLAVPFIIDTADSKEAAFKSCILVFAISSTCASVTLATLSLCGFADPLCTPAAFFNRTAAGGVYSTCFSQKRDDE